MGHQSPASEVLTQQSRDCLCAEGAAAQREGVDE